MSDLIDAHADRPDPALYERFLTLFRDSVIGVVAEGTPVTTPDGRTVSGSDMRVGNTTHGDGRSRILAWADPEAARANFGPRFNAGIAGATLLEMAGGSEGCAGILVNSATREVSLIISAETAAELTA
ncbi:hypothetical protein [Dactylosporangium sp. NPDC051541]|uniref:hypothetical protein n=1 Tax=Dactylosporangium sp. NPDC051541 TaxID=3363977 RepID=UPI0037B1C123